MNLDQVFDPKLAEAFRFGVNDDDTADCYAGERVKRRSAIFLNDPRSAIRPGSPPSPMNILRKAWKKCFRKVC